MSSPAPLLPPDVDLTDFAKIMIDITRLRGSAFDAMHDSEAWRAGVNLWLSSWHNTPAGSLDDDPESLCKAAGLGRDMRGWQRVRDKALRHWVSGGDGKIYHPVVCEVALEAWIEKLATRLQSARANATRWKREIDLTPIYADVDAAAAALRALNPKSEKLLKGVVVLPRDPGGIAGGTSTDDPGGTATGMHAASRTQSPKKSSDRPGGGPTEIPRKGKGREERTIAPNRADSSFRREATSALEGRSPPHAEAEGDAAARLGAIPEPIWRAVLTARGQEFVDSYLTCAEWRAEPPALVFRVKFSADQFQRACRSLMIDLGVAVVCESTMAAKAVA